MSSLTDRASSATRTAIPTAPAPTDRESAGGETGRVILDLIRRGELPPPPAAELLGIDLEVVADGETVFGFDAVTAYGNPGNVHGGVLAAIGDFAVTTAVWTRLPAASDIVTADLHVSFVRGIPLDGARYRATGSVLHLGRTQANAVATIAAVDGTVHAQVLATCRVRVSPP